MYISIIYILLNEGKHYLIAAKYNLIEWIKTRALTKTINKNMTKFIKKEFVSCYSGYKILVVDKNFKNKFLIKNLIGKFEIKRKIISVYHF